MDCFLGRSYRLRSKIGSGSFGSVFIGINVKTGSEYAVKVEPIERKRSHLLHEARLYRALHGGHWIPRMHKFVTEGSYHVLVLDLLGPSLEDLFHFCNRSFGLKTVLMLADQMLKCIEYIHGKDVVHNDVKPANFTIGAGKRAHQVYLIDFGSASCSRLPVSSMSTPQGSTQTTPRTHVRGNLCYRGVIAHFENEPSRREDLESVGYVLIYFLRGILPWQGLTDKHDIAIKRQIIDIMVSTDLRDLCQGCNSEFKFYLEYCRSLYADEWPDHSYVRRLFTDLFDSLQYERDFAYDWTIPRHVRENKKEHCLVDSSDESTDVSSR
eukprot:TRINITY_DN53988_c0_g1_i1.p1 TRINITY_DN53988_c0_g1~~TRINITY_DN53988_c0_g1_i1.p1  ORF type:complete len:333 (-),score=25.41 TRINITY_DN53988_c0_g1_i1:443-1414(-)